MVTVASSKDKDSLAEIWEQCFTDDKIFIENFLNNCFPYSITFIYKISCKIVACATLIPSNIYIKTCNASNKLTGFYLYAVATLPAFRGHGISKKIIDQCIKYSYLNNADYISVFPAKDELYPLYYKLGFNNYLYSSIYNYTNSSSQGPEIKPILKDKISVFSQIEKYNNILLFPEAIEDFINKDIIHKNGSIYLDKNKNIYISLPSEEDPELLNIYTTNSEVSEFTIFLSEEKKKGLIYYPHKTSNDTKEKRGLIKILNQSLLSDLCKVFILYPIE
jgi:GNAT superfamily N-acetyltransferase